MRAILVAVDFDDLLSVTLPYNRHHFEEVVIVTTPNQTETRRIAMANDAEVLGTNSFYEPGAIFNKCKALEEGLDWMGREGWLCLMDADVLWPKKVPDFQKEVGRLYTPLRRIQKEIGTVPEEKDWEDCPIYVPGCSIFAGYSQIFHASDPILGNPPWHQTNWKHAGGGDTYFQLKWPRAKKIRPPFEVLHLGNPGENWCGRATQYLDGTTHPEAEKRLGQCKHFIKNRKRGRGINDEKY